MLSKDQVLKAVQEDKVGYNREANQMIDSRDYLRLAGYFPASDCGSFGFRLKEGTDIAAIKILDWNKDTIMSNFKRDLEFAFEKAKNKRGISTSLMFEVINMYLWILEDTQMQEENYTGYALPFYHEVRDKYFPDMVVD